MQNNLCSNNTVSRTKSIKQAPNDSYYYILLDTLPLLEKAIDMYKQFGFYTIDCYNNSPMSTSIYMRLDL